MAPADTVAVPVEVQHTAEVPAAAVEPAVTIIEAQPAPTPAEVEAQTDATVEIIEAQSDADVARIEAEGRAAAEVVEAVGVGEQIATDLAELKAWREATDARLTGTETSLSQILGTLETIAANTSSSMTTQQNNGQETPPAANPGNAPPGDQDRNAESIERRETEVLRARRFRKI